MKTAKCSCGPTIAEDPSCAVHHPYAHKLQTQLDQARAKLAEAKREAEREAKAAAVLAIEIALGRQLARIVAWLEENPMASDEDDDAYYAKHYAARIRAEFGSRTP